MLEQNTRMGDRSRGECLTGMADDLHSHYTQTSVREKLAYWPYLRKSLYRIQVLGITLC